MYHKTSQCLDPSFKFEEPFLIFEQRLFLADSMQDELIRCGETEAATL
jgi:hypothetical protein